MTKVLVTGANGFVGNHVVKELHSNGIYVVGIGGSQQAMSQPSQVDTYLQLDLLNTADVAKIDFRDIDGVVHLAGLTEVGASFSQPMQYLTVNVGIETNLFEEVLRQSAKPRFLIISSGTLYDPKAPMPLTESSLVLPHSPYAVSKLGQEQMAQYYSQRGLECIIARPFNHIGPGQNLGFIIPDLTKQVIDVEQGRASHVLVGNLDSRRDYTDVRDIARAYRLLLELGRPGELYNLCSGDAQSGHDMLKLIIRESGTNPPIKQDPARIRPSDNPVLYGDHSKITADIGWQPQISLETTIRDVVADWRGRDE